MNKPLFKTEICHILVADDEKTIRQVLKEELSQAGCEVTTVINGEKAIEAIEMQDFQVIILDNKMPKVDGLTVLKRLNKENKDMVIIMMTAYGSIDHAVEAMKLGASDYITKPFDTDEMLTKINHHLTATKPLIEKDKKEHFFSRLIGAGKAFEETVQFINRVKDINTTLLITGESGTGKGVVAKEIHMKGNRRDKPFIHINCATLPVNLIESELFGHVKGAFTGAHEDKKGKFEIAEGGTIFLDEISLLDKQLQAKLLTVLQEKRFEKIGSGKTQYLKARIIAATNEDIYKEVEKGHFRKDLFYRLNVISIPCLPLKDRVEDIPLLAGHFLKKYNKLHGKQVGRIDEEVLNLFSQYSWPGNVRELENIIEREVAMSNENTITVEGLNSRIELNNSCENISNSSEYEAIVKALEQNGGHREKTAESLGISRRTLQYRLKAYGLK